MGKFQTDEILDFNASYVGQMSFKEVILPVKLFFTDNKIKLSVITEGINLSYLFLKKETFKGKVLTLGGMKSFKAYDVQLIKASEKFNGTSSYEFLINSLIIYNVNSQEPENSFNKFNLTYNSLHKIGKLQNIESNQKSDFPFIIDKTFESCIFCNCDRILVTYHNVLIWNFLFQKKEILITSKPYIEIRTDNLTIEGVRLRAKALGWFLQLIFGIKQDLQGVLLFIDYDMNSEPYSYYQSEIISTYLEEKANGVPPPFNIEDIQEDISVYYSNWEGFDQKQRLFCRLFFNEINSNNVVLDDRFKNLCSLIQGLEIIAGKKLPTEIKTRNSMLAKLLGAIDNHSALTFSNVPKHFIIKLSELIAVQRDFYQHMNKPLSYDFGNYNDEMNIANGFLIFIVKVYLLDAIGIEEKASEILKRDHDYVENSLLKLQRNFNERDKIKNLL